MDKSRQTFTDASSLQDAIKRGVVEIGIEGSIVDLPSLSLPKGTRMRGTGDGAELHFKQGQPGLLLSADHEISGLRLVTNEAQVALGLADDADDLGTIAIIDVVAVGRVHLEGNKANRGELKLANIHVERADARMAAHRPAGFGVEVLLGGITVYNLSRNSESRWSVEARNLSGGSEDCPLRGSGVFVFGGCYIPIDADMSSAPAPTQQGDAST